MHPVRNVFVVETGREVLDEFLESKQADPKSARYIREPNSRLVQTWLLRNLAQVACDFLGGAVV